MSDPNWHPAAHDAVITKQDPGLGKQVMPNGGETDDRYGYGTSDAFADFAGR